MRIVILYIFLSVCNITLMAQVKNPKLQEKLNKADEFFDHKNYLMALSHYKDLLKKEPENKYLMARLSVCYLNTNYNRTEPIKLLETLVKDEKIDIETWYYLGVAYHLSNKIDEAIEAFEKYKSLKPGKANIAKADRKIEMCNNAKKLMGTPINVSFLNLGPDVNSPDPDYYPFVNEDESFLIFTSRRKENLGGNKIEIDGYRPSDIWLSKVENGKWIKAYSAGKNINTNYDEQCVSLNYKGSEMVVYIDLIEKYGDLYTSAKGPNGEFMKIKPLPEIINDKKFIETTGCFGSDNNSFFFARREGINEQSDIYMIRKLPNGQWGKPFKLPPQVNTQYNEDFPYLSADGITLYFSSEGHNSMGGYDLFKSIWNPDDNTWSEAENLGYPLNSTDDDRSICITPDNRVGYISTFRPNGQGDLDIYRVKFNEANQVVRIFTGKVFLGDSTNIPATTVASITAKNIQTKEEFTFVPRQKTATFLMALDAGNYQIIVHSDGYEDYKEDLKVSDIGKIEIEKNKNYFLKKK